MRYLNAAFAVVQNDGIGITEVEVGCLAMSLLIMALDFPEMMRFELETLDGSAFESAAVD